MKQTNEFRRVWRNAMRSSQRATHRAYTAKANRPYMLREPPSPGSLHEMFVQLIQPVDFVEELLVRQIAGVADRLQRANSLVAALREDPRPAARAEFQSAQNYRATVKADLRSLVAQFRSRRPKP